MQFAQYEPYLLVGLVGWSLLFFVVGLWPFDFHWPGEWRIYYWPTPINGPLNFLSFLPFGVFVAALGYVTKYALEDKGLRDTRMRIKTYRIIEEEQRLTMEILQHKIAIAKIQAQFAPKDPNDP